MAATTPDAAWRERFHRLNAAPDAGLASEREIGCWLVAALPPEAGYAVRNGMDRGRGGIDHIVIGPTGLWVLETKYWRGEHHIINDAQGTWVRFDHERKFSHPHQQLVENCDWLVRHL